MIDDCKTGSCPTLTLASTNNIATLISSEFPEANVKVVTWAKHVFSLVQSDSELIIFDPWANAMGHHGIFTTRSYPYQGMLSPLTVVFDLAAEKARADAV